jgi:hypothetical protein
MNWWCWYLCKIWSTSNQGSWCDPAAPHPQMHPPIFPFWQHPVRGTWILEPLAIGRSAGEQEPNDKKCPVHTPSIHGGAFVGGCWFTLAKEGHVLWTRVCRFWAHSTHRPFKCHLKYPSSCQIDRMTKAGRIYIPSFELVHLVLLPLHGKL